MRVEASTNPTNPYRLIFEGQQEIEVVRTAYIEYSYNLDMEGRSSDVTSFDRAISDWQRDDPIKKIVIMRRALITARPALVVNKIYELHDNTEAVTEDMVELIGEVADADQVEMRMAGVEWRQNLGIAALTLAQTTDAKLNEYMIEELTAIDLDVAFARILAPKQLGP